MTIVRWLMLRNGAANAGADAPDGDIQIVIAGKDALEVKDIVLQSDEEVEDSWSEGKPEVYGGSAVDAWFRLRGILRSECLGF
jgi:hypothetical protein